MITIYQIHLSDSDIIAINASGWDASPKTSAYAKLSSFGHDRGCPCGKESWDYNFCTEKNCYKSKNTVRDTDWRPSPCPNCGELRAAAKRPQCLNIACDEYAGNERSMNYVKQYLWVKLDRAPTFVTDLIALYKDRDFDAEQDQIFEIGPEVKLELSVKVTPTKPTTRENASGYRTSFANRD